MTVQITKILETLKLSPKVPTAKKALDIKIQQQALKTIAEEPTWSSSYQKTEKEKNAYSTFYSD